ncbi:hypothetical protein GGR53DRAFT_263214 [Hypoxylon sp. FL1150]|nr:hypothetical protein GGR53DRAFT_263214 [Hypoxylon sp. FL1150]
MYLSRTQPTAMSHHTSSNDWWQRNHLAYWNYAVFPTKKELIYRIFRAAYPQGAFVDDNLNLAELRDKDVIWSRLQEQIRKATFDLSDFLTGLFEEEPPLRFDVEKQQIIRDYYKALLREAESDLFVSQNGRYFEFRCMEELLVRYRKADPKTWMKEPEQGKPRLPLPRVDGFKFAQEHLDLRDTSDVKYHQRGLNRLLE